ncbi:MAG: hypothetical protein ABL901_03930 [Hyphomicrobiaceae bacterium]
MSFVEDLAVRLNASGRTSYNDLGDAARQPVSGQQAERFFAIPASNANGFDILVWPDADSVRVCFGGLDQKFDTNHGARIWIERAMTSDCSLRIDFAGKRPYRWSLTYTNPDGSEPDQLIAGQGSITGLFAKKWSAERRNAQSDYNAKHRTIPVHLLGH